MLSQTTITVSTHGRSTLEITAKINAEIANTHFKQGLCHLFIQHTSASLIICENEDPNVRVDLENFMSNLVQDGDRRFIHTQEGPDDMSAHIRNILTENNLMIPVKEGKLNLGVWQGVFLWEHRLASHERKILMTLISG